MALLNFFNTRTIRGLRDIEPVYQGEVSECGLASATMVMQALGRDVSLKDLRERYAASLLGMSLADLVNVLDEYGIEASPVRFEGESLSELPLPAILHVGGNHYVVVMRVAGSLYHVFDPAVGERIIHEGVMGSIVTGYAVIPATSTQVICTERSKRFNNWRVRLKSLAHRAGGIRIIGLVFLGGGLSFITPLFAGVSIDKILDSSGGHKYWSTGMAFLLASIGAFYYERFCGRILLKASANAGMLAFSKGFGMLMRNRLRYFTRRMPGELVERFVSYGGVAVERLRIDNTIFCSGIVALIAISMMAWLQPLLALVSMVGITVSGMLTLRYASIVQDLRRQSEQASAAQQQFLLETIQGVTAWKSANTMRRRLNAYLDHGNAVVRAWRRRGEIGLRQRTAYGLLGNIEFLVMLSVAASAMVSGQLTFGGFYAFAFIRQITLSSVTQVYDSWISLRSMTVVDARAKDMFEHLRDNHQDKVGVFHYSLQVKGCHFQHEGSTVTLNDINVEIQSGAKVALLGSSGCGKTTLLTLLSGLETPHSGSLIIDGEPVNDWAQLRNLCYLQTAHDIIFSGSVFDNITMFDPVAGRTECWAWIESVGLASRIREFPAGIDTQISDTTASLSAGERQRLLVARALFAGRPVGLFDEPTANLDETNARLVLSAITTAQYAAVVVTHDKSNLDLFDVIYELRNGTLYRMT